MTWLPLIAQAWLELPASHPYKVTAPLSRRGGLPASRHMTFPRAGGELTGAVWGAELAGVTADGELLVGGSGRADDDERMRVAGPEALTAEGLGSAEDPPCRIGSSAAATVAMAPSTAPTSTCQRSNQRCSLLRSTFRCPSRSCVLTATVCHHSASECHQTARGASIPAPGSAQSAGDERTPAGQLALRECQGSSWTVQAPSAAR
jgi:hypothetical protein